MGSWEPVGYKKLKILLMGPRRTGKSSAGNTLLGRGRAFDIRGGGRSTAASAVAAGRHVAVVDAQGWASSEESREDKIELLRALDLCGPAGPHSVLLVIPLLDFTEPERRVVEKRMELFTSAVWRHTMVLFTFGDRLRSRGLSIWEHIQSGGPALHWLLDKCRYRYHVFDNKTPGRGQHDSREVGKKQERAGGGSREGEADAGEGGEQEQVKGLLGKIEDMLQENGGWHFSLHMYQRLEEEWSRREKQLRARLEAETEARGARRKQKPEETDFSVTPEQEPEEEQEGGPRNGKMNREEEDTTTTTTRELQSRSSQEDGSDTGSDSGGEREEETRATMEADKEIGIMVPYQRLAFSLIRRLP